MGYGKKYGIRQSRLTGHAKESKYRHIQCTTCKRWFSKLPIHLATGYACRVLRGVEN